MDETVTEETTRRMVSTEETNMRNGFLISLNSKSIGLGG